MNEVTSLVLSRSLFGFLWDDQRLRSLDLPVRDVPVDLLRWHLDKRQWRDGDQLFALTPNEVRRQPRRYHQQWRRVWRSDLHYPLDALLDDDRWTILDGLHRLLKADLLGYGTVPVRELRRRHLDLIRVVADGHVSSATSYARQTGVSRCAL